MQLRTLRWTLVATLVLVIGGAVAASAQDAAAPTPALTLSASSADASGAAGSTASYALQVASTTAQNVSLSFDALPDGLSGAFDPNVTTVTPDAPASAAFTVAIAPDAHSDDPISIVVHAVGDDGSNASLALHLGIRATPTARIVLSPDPTALTIAPGGSAYDNVTITAYDAPASVSLGTFASPGYTASSWPVSFDLQPGVGQSFRVAIDALDNATSGYVGLVASDAAHRETKAAIRLDVPAPAPAPTANASSEPTFEILMDPSTQTVAPGGYATFVLHAKSTRNVTLDLGVGQMSDHNWSTAFTPLSLDISAGGDGVAKLLVHAPPNATGVKMDVLARARDTLEMRDAWIRAAVKAPEPVAHSPSLAASSARFALGATPQRQTLGPDGVARFTVGAKSAENVTLTLGLVGRIAPGYHATLASDTLDVLAGSYATTELVVTADDAANATTRDAAFEVFAVAPDGERHAVTVHVGALGVAPESRPEAKPAPAPTAQRPLLASANATKDAGAIVLSLQGFDGARGLHIVLQIGERTIDLHVSGQLLRQMAEPTSDLGGDTGHHSPAWLRLQLDPETDAATTTTSDA